VLSIVCASFNFLCSALSMPRSLSFKSQAACIAFTTSAVFFFFFGGSLSHDSVHVRHLFSDGRSLFCHQFVLFLLIVRNDGLKKVSGGFASLLVRL
jgi:hypothetical protein